MLWARERLLTAAEHMPTPKEDCEALLDAALPFVEEQLDKYGEFFPIGATMSPSGEITPLGGYTGNERPLSDDVIQLLEDGFRTGAKAGSYRATALFFEVRVTPPGKTSAQDAVAVRLDHRDQYSAIVFFPYVLAAGVAQWDAPFATQGEGTIFGSSSAGT
jgi:hypothetical protein